MLATTEAAAMTANALSFSGWPPGMDNIHADHDLDAKTLINCANP